MDAKEKLLLWKTVMALQAVDGLKTSAKVIDIAKKNIEGDIADEALLDECESLKNEADLVAVRMFVNIMQNQFSLSQFELVQIRKALFAGILESPELLRTANLSKKEWALDGHALVYPKAAKIQTQLNKLFEAETLFDFGGLDSKQIYKHCASFISSLWALHPFETCNTRSLAVFFIKYLAFRGFALSNDVLSRAVLDPRETHLYYDANGVVLKEQVAAQKEQSSSARLDEKLLAQKSAPAKKAAAPKAKKAPAKKAAPKKAAVSKTKKKSAKA